jgi:CRP/FNR family transcriptional regulator
MHTRNIATATPPPTPRHARPAAGRDAAPSGQDELQAALGAQRQLARNQHLFCSGERCTELYLVQDGSVESYRLSPAGDEQIVSFHFAGDMVGLDALGTLTHGCSAVALETTHVRALALTAVHALCRHSALQQHRILQLASRRIVELQDRMLTLGRMSATERLAGFLLELAARAHPSQLKLSMSLYHIGCYLGLALETVSRLLREFENEGLIQREGRWIRIEAPKRLRALATGQPHAPD